MLCPKNRWQVSRQAHRFGSFIWKLMLGIFLLGFCGLKPFALKPSLQELSIYPEVPRLVSLKLQGESDPIRKLWAQAQHAIKAPVHEFGYEMERHASLLSISIIALPITLEYIFTLELETRKETWLASHGSLWYPSLCGPPNTPQNTAIKIF